MQGVEDPMRANVKAMVEPFRVTGAGRLTESNIKDTLRQVRLALLEADVALPVVRDFVARVKERAVGAEVARSLTPGQALIKIIHDELVRTLGEAESSLDLATQPPAVILLAGLQAIPAELYEAAQIDGAGAWRSFLNITASGCPR